MESKIVYGKKVPSLYKLCLIYVARNIGHVESWRGFPSLMAEEIFHMCLEVGSLDQNDEGTIHALEEFGSEFGSQFMSSLRCHSITFLSEYEEALVVLFTYLTRLDLSGCQFGNSYSLLPDLHELPCLEVLSLKDNQLSDAGFKNLTFRHRVLKKGFESLKELDVSLNEVSAVSMKQILRLPRLTKLRFTLSNSRNEYINAIMSLLKTSGFELWDQRREAFDPIANVGWGCPLLCRWEDKIEEYEEARIKRLSETTRSAFQKHRDICYFYEPVLTFYGNQTADSSIEKKTFTYVSVRPKILSSKEGDKRVKEVKSQNRRVTNSLQEQEAPDFDSYLLNLYKM